MPRLTLADYDQLKQRIASHIEDLGYVPPMDDLVVQFGCAKTTAWRIVRALGWRANYRHRWVRAVDQAPASPGTP
jgi:hypothetical protein